MKFPPLVWNSASNLLLFLTNVVVSFVMAPVLVGALGNESYGLWEVMLGLVGYLGVLDLGLGPALLRNVAMAQGSGDERQLREVVNAGTAGFFLAGLVACGVVCLVAWSPETVLNAKSAHLELLVFVFAAIILMTFVRAPFSCYLLGLQLHRVVFTVRTLSTVGQAAAVWGILQLAEGLRLPLMGAAVGLFCGGEAILFWAVSRHVGHKIVARPLDARWVAIRGLLGFGAKSAVLMAAVGLVKQGILLAIAHAPGIGEVVYFVMPAKVAEYATGVTIAIGGPLGALLARSYGQGGIAATRSAWLSTTRGLQVLAYGSALGTLWMGGPFLSRWLGPAIAENSATSLKLFSVGLLLQALATNSNRVLVAMNLHGKAAAVAAGLGLGSVVVAFLVLPALGVSGAAAVFVAYQTIQAWVETRSACRAMGVGTLRYVASTAWAFLPSLGTGSAVFWILRRLHEPLTYLAIALESLAGGMTFAVAAWLSAFTRDQRHEICKALGLRKPGADPASPDLP